MPPPNYRPQAPPPVSSHSMPPPRGFQSGPPPNNYGPPPRFANPVMPSQSAAPLNPLPSNSQASAADEEKNQAEMLLKVINLTDQQVNLLPPEDRAKVMELRNQLRQRIGAEQMS